MDASKAGFGKRPVPTTPAVYEPEPGSFGRAGWLLLPIAVVGLFLFVHHAEHSSRPAPAISATVAKLVNGEDPELPSLAGIPNVSVDYYDLAGSDAASIRAQLNAAGPLSADGHRFDGDTHWHYSWNWSPAADGSCGTANALVSFQAVIHLPHLTRYSALQPEVAEQWRSYIDALARHEAGHVVNGYSGRDSVRDAVRTASCESANAAGTAAVARLEAQDKQYDADTGHGATQGATFG